MPGKYRLLKIAYRYKGFDYLVADTAGNLYLIPHFRFRRTVYFKQLIPFENGTNKKKTIKYHGSNVSFMQLQKKAYEANETIEVY
jgi:hypothetical protein